MFQFRAGFFLGGGEGFKMFQVVLLVIMCPNLGNVLVFYHQAYK